MVSINNQRNPSAPKGTLGLATGIDSESVIQGMLQPVRLKIDKQQGLKQQIQWRQDHYRQFITQLTSLQQRFFSFQNPSSNLMSSTFFQRKSVNSSSSLVSATATQFAPSQLVIDRIEQLAKPTQLKGPTQISAPIRLSVNEALLNETNELNVTLDGQTQIIRFNAGTQDEVFSQINARLSALYGGSVSIDAQGVVNTQHHRQVTLGGTSSALNALGLNSVTSNFVRLESTLNALQLQQPLLGESFTMKINGVDLSFKSSDTITSILNTINRSDANVTVSYSSLTDSFELSSKSTGQGVSIDVQDGIGNMAQVLFGVGSTSSLESKSLMSAQPLVSVGVIEPFDLSQPFEMNVNGVVQSFTISSLPEGEEHTIETIITQLNSQFAARTATADISLSVIDHQIHLSSPTQRVSFTTTEGLHAQLGFSFQSNAISESTLLSDLNMRGELNINGTPITLNDQMTLDDLISTLSTNDVQLSITNHRLALSSTQPTTLQGNMLSTLFNTTSIVLNQPAALGNIVQGQNAILSVNGVSIERNTNTFEVNGYRLTLAQTSEQAITLTSTQQINPVMESIQAFVKDYNQLIDDIRKVTNEKTEFRDYPPLSEDQKKEMSESEITLWEEKAKTGLLRNDRVLTSLASELRQILFNRPEGSTLSLSDIGISSGNYANYGKLTIDEAKLRQSLETNLEGVTTLFTHSSEGLAQRIDKTIKNAIQTSSTQPGSLVRLAGVANTASVNKNQLTAQMSAIDKVIENLNRTYDAQKERYWRQFSRLESVISKMNAQSAWLSQQTGMM